MHTFDGLQAHPVNAEQAERADFRRFTWDHKGGWNYGAVVKIDNETIFLEPVNAHHKATCRQLAQVQKVDLDDFMVSPGVVYMFKCQKFRKKAELDRPRFEFVAHGAVRVEDLHEDADYQAALNDGAGGAVASPPGTAEKAYVVVHKKNDAQKVQAHH